MQSKINSEDCCNIEINFVYLNRFEIKIVRIFTDPIAFSGAVWDFSSKYGDKNHLFNLETFLTVEEVISHSFQECDQFVIDYPPEINDFTYQVPNFDSPDDSIPF
jgi:hypothetical protein